MRVNGQHYRTVWLDGSSVKMINQPLLPHSFEIFECATYQDTARAIREMIVRGAGAIGAAAGFGMAQAALAGTDLHTAKSVLDTTRPTARNLFYATERVLRAGREGAVKEAQAIADEDVDFCQRIGQFGSELIRDGSRILTHCNAGWLAFVDWGSALSPVYSAIRQGKNVFVWVDETRPRCQGARLTAWELAQEGVPHTVIADNAAGYYMKRGEIDLVIVGADRVTANGDVANKIGTYEKAVLAKENGIPFYVAVPSSTIDFRLNSGSEIPIEERSEDEVLYMFGINDKGERARVRIAPQGTKASNPAFDVTPARYVTGFITERGIFKPYELKRIR